jgi:hypothetical protein
VWSLHGHVVRLAWGFTTRVVVDGALTDLELPSRIGDRELDLGGRHASFRVGHQPGSRVLFVDLYSGGELVPPSTAPAVMTAPPPDARCAAHRDAPAAGICVRCGSFACAECCKPTGVHCATCLPLLQVDAPFVSMRSNPVPIHIAGTLFGAAAASPAIKRFPDSGFLIFCVGLGLGVALSFPFRGWIDTLAIRSKWPAFIRRGAVAGTLALAVLIVALVTGA